MLGDSVEAFLADRGYDADASAPRSPAPACRPSFPPNAAAAIRRSMIATNTACATGSSDCSANSRTGDASPHGTTKPKNLSRFRQPRLNQSLATLCPRGLASGDRNRSSSAARQKLMRSRARHLSTISRTPPQYFRNSRTGEFLFVTCSGSRISASSGRTACRREQSKKPRTGSGRASSRDWPGHQPTTSTAQVLLERAGARTGDSQHRAGQPRISDSDPARSSEVRRCP